MSFIEVFSFTFLILCLFAGIVLSVFGLPGALLIAVVVTIYALLSIFTLISFKTLLVVLLCAVVAETVGIVMEKNIYKVTPNRATAYAAIVGVFLCTFTLTPMVYGLGIIIGLFLGSLFGVLYGEVSQQRKSHNSLRTSPEIVVSRLVSVTMRGCISVIMVIITLLSIYS